MGNTIGMVYEITNNPHYRNLDVEPESPLSELVMPSEMDRISQALTVLGHEVEVIDGPWGLLRMADELKKKRNLIIFNKSRGLSGLERKIFVPAICQLYGFPLVGSSAYGVTLARHKYHTNRLLAGLGFNVPTASICYPGQCYSINPNFNYPVILKPNHESGALGISEDSIFSDRHGIAEFIKKLHDTFNQPVIIEEFVDGEEWKVAVIGNGFSTKALGCVGVMRNNKPIVGSLQTRDDLLNERINYYRPQYSKLAKKAYDLSIRIHQVLECKDYSRCDFRIGKDGNLVCMEVSTHPDLGENSSFMQAAMQTIGDYETIIAAILEAFATRY